MRAELQGLPNVLLTPHIGGSTEEAQAAIGVEVASALIKFINVGSSVGAVNFPQARTQRYGMGTCFTTRQQMRQTSCHGSLRTAVLCKAVSVRVESALTPFIDIETGSAVNIPQPGWRADVHHALRYALEWLSQFVAL